MIRLVCLSLPTLQTRRIRADLVKLFKILTGRLSIDPIGFFRAPLTANRRGHLKLHLSLPRSKVRSSFLIYRSIRELDTLLSENESIDNMSVSFFKRLIALRFR